MKYVIVDMNVPIEKHDELIHKLETEDYDKCVFVAWLEWQYWFSMSTDKIWPKLVKAIKSRGKKLDVISGAHKVLHGEPIDNDIIVHNWDTFWINLTEKSISLDYVVDNYQYHYISMNNRSHLWRCQLIDLVVKNDLLKHGAVSWHNHFVDYDWKYFNPTSMRLTDSFDKNDSDMNKIFMLPKEYHQSFAQLVSESNVDAIFLTEKTAIPLLVGKPFLVATAANYHMFLESLGFKLYDEIFDYSFDKESDQLLRFDMLLENFNRLCKMPLADLDSLHLSIKDKLEYNKNRAIELSHVQPDIVGAISSSLNNEQWVTSKYIILDK